jgi:hypothetical protein
LGSVEMLLKIVLVPDFTYFINLGSTVGYSDFHNLMRFTSKKMPNNILKNVC